MNNVSLVGKLEDEPQILTKDGTNRFFYFKLRVLNENGNDVDRINCAVYNEMCAIFYTNCKKNDVISITGRIIPNTYMVQGVIVHSYNVVVNKVEVVASEQINYRPNGKLKDEFKE